MKNILFIFLASILISSTALAEEVKLEANWAWNGTDKTITGFKFYLDGKVVQDVPDPAARSIEMVLDMANGKHMFSMTAYGPDWESDHSPEYPFEYLHVENNGRPAPTVIIRIN